MKSVVLIAVFSLLFASTITTGEASAHLTTTARLKLEKFLGRAVIPTLSQAQVSELQRLFERRLRLLRLRNAVLAQRECLATKRRAVGQATNALRAARDCTYNGLTWLEFTEYRRICDTRFTATGAALQAALEACALIGRAGPQYTPPPCANIASLKADLDAATEALLACGAGALTLQEIEALLAAVEQLITAVLAGQPTPSNDPRFPTLDAF